MMPIMKEKKKTMNGQAFSKDHRASARNARREATALSASRLPA
jgi:hypothetical protein